MAGPASLDKKLEEALIQQQEDTAKSKKAKESGKEGEAEDMKKKKKLTVLTEYKCPVCMDSPVDATTTICGKYSYTLLFAICLERRRI